MVQWRIYRLLMKEVIDLGLCSLHMCVHELNVHMNIAVVEQEQP